MSSKKKKKNLKWFTWKYTVYTECVFVCKVANKLYSWKQKWCNREAKHDCRFLLRQVQVNYQKGGQDISCIFRGNSTDSMVRRENETRTTTTLNHWKSRRLFLGRWSCKELVFILFQERWTRDWKIRETAVLIYRAFLQPFTTPIRVFAIRTVVLIISRCSRNKGEFLSSTMNEQTGLCHSF